MTVIPRPSEEQTFDGRGFALRYGRHGRGEQSVPLVLLHGRPESRRIFDRVVKPLAATSAAGSSRSSPCASRSSYEYYAQEWAGREPGIITRNSSTLVANLLQ